MDSAKIGQELKNFFLHHGVQQVAMSEGNMGCPHEEGEDLPPGKDCPFWKGKLGREGECGNPLPALLLT
jgi:hypothetical protein